MQITVLPRCISALNSCSAHVTQTAIRAVAAARRAPGSGRRTSGFSWATSDALAADPFHVTPGWSDAWPEAGRRGARRLPAGVPSPILRPRTAACGRPGSIVMPMSSPRNLATRPAPRSPSPADPSRAHQCQLRMSRSFVRNGCCSAGHQCQLRTSHSFRSRYRRSRPIHQCQLRTMRLLSFRSVNARLHQCQLRMAASLSDPFAPKGCGRALAGTSRGPRQERTCTSRRVRTAADGAAEPGVGDVIAIRVNACRPRRSGDVK
jgi:hypothetical protein